LVVIKKLNISDNGLAYMAPLWTSKMLGK